MADELIALEEATAALAATAERAAVLIRHEAERARDEASRTRGQIENVQREISATRTLVAAPLLPAPRRGIGHAVAGYHEAEAR